MELDNKKSEGALVALPGIRQTSRVAFFATALGWLMTQRAGRRSLDNKKSEGARGALKGIRQTSRVAFFATALGWLMTQRAGRRSLDNKKSEGSRLAATSAGSLPVTVLQPLLERLKRPYRGK